MSESFRAVRRSLSAGIVLMSKLRFVAFSLPKRLSGLRKSWRRSLGRIALFLTGSACVPITPFGMYFSVDLFLTCLHVGGADLETQSLNTLFESLYRSTPDFCRCTLVNNDLYSSGTMPSAGTGAEPSLACRLDQGWGRRCSCSMGRDITHIVCWVTESFFLIAARWCLRLRQSLCPFLIRREWYVDKKFKYSTFGLIRRV